MTDQNQSNEKKVIKPSDKDSEILSFPPAINSIPEDLNEMFITAELLETQVLKELGAKLIQSSESSTIVVSPPVRQKSKLD